jgi:hypothetical protein
MLTLSLFLISCCSLLIANSLAQTAPHMEPKNLYANRKVLLSEPNLYKLYWNYSQTDVIYELMVKQTNGWFFFGFTSNDSLVDGKFFLILKFLKQS